VARTPIAEGRPRRTGRDIWPTAGAGTLVQSAAAKAAIGRPPSRLAGLRGASNGRYHEGLVGG